MATDIIHTIIYIIRSLLYFLLPITLYWIYWRFTHRRMIELAALVPGPPTLPVLGNALLFMAQPEEQLNKIAALINTYGQYLKFWLGPDLNICVKNPTDVRYLLTSNKVNQKGPLYDVLVPYIGYGILTGGPQWRESRKIATPSYNKKSVQIFFGVFNREADELARTLTNKNPFQTFDVYFDVVDCTTQCVCQTLMGLSKEETQNVQHLSEVVLMTQSMYTVMFSKMTKWWLKIPFVYWLSGFKKIEKYYRRIIDELSSDILDKRRKALKQNPVYDENAMGVVDRYILEGFNDANIKLELFSLFTTSQEASAKIASAVLLFLAHLPEWQEKVHKEVVDTIGPHDDVTEEHLKKLQNLDLVFKEVIRYMSIAAFIQRTVEEEVTINEGKITLPRGTSLIIPIHEIHRDPQYWDEPYKIKPDRFLPENAMKRDPNAFIPFSLGPMDCLGRVYATALIKTLVVKVIRQVHLEADGNIEDLELHVAISVKFAKGYNLRTRPRKLDLSIDNIV